jgi:hypothetical protein
MENAQEKLVKISEKIKSLKKFLGISENSGFFFHLRLKKDGVKINEISIAELQENENDTCEILNENSSNSVFLQGLLKLYDTDLLEQFLQKIFDYFSTTPEFLTKKTKEQQAAYLIDNIKKTKVYVSENFTKLYVIYQQEDKNIITDKINLI